METFLNLRPNFVCEELSEWCVFMAKLLSITQSGVFSLLFIGCGFFLRSTSADLFFCLLCNQIIYSLFLSFQTGQVGTNMNGCRDS